MEYRLLDAFRGLFEGERYRHRSSRLGDWVAMHLYEDLFDLGRSPKFRERVESRDRALSSTNRRRGIEARRGDGTFGVLVPGSTWLADEGFHVARGEIANVEIGVEVKILAKAMIKQIDRVISDLKGQAEHLRRGGGDPLCVAVVGVNDAEVYTSYEGKRTFRTTGKDGYLHPVQESKDAERRIREQVTPKYNELIVLQFGATNSRPYPFEWVDEGETEKDYGSALVRISQEYERRF